MIMTKKPNSFFNMQFITSSISTTLVLLLLGMVVFFVLSANNLSNYVRENIGFTVLVSDDMKEPEALKFQKALNENALTNSVLSTPNKFWVIIMCPVEDTGKNSVNPSTMAIIMVSNILMSFYFFGLRRIP